MVTENLQKMSDASICRQQDEAVAMETDTEMSAAQKHFQSERSKLFHSKRTVDLNPSHLEHMKNARVNTDAAILNITGTL